MATEEMPKKVEEGEVTLQAGWPPSCLTADRRRPPPPPAAAVSSRLSLTRLFTPAASPTRRLTPALFYRLKQHGFKQCQGYSEAYAECCHGRVFSIVWACRKEMKALSDCMSTQ